jgi:threonine dehydrogenase-like Zn-dependent dehydrogenase
MRNAGWEPEKTGTSAECGHLRQKHYGGQGVRSAEPSDVSAECGVRSAECGNRKPKIKNQKFATQFNDSTVQQFNDLAALVHHTTSGRGLDGAAIAVPSDDVVREAQSLVRGGGQVLLFSHTRRGAETPLDLATICVDEKDLIGSYSADFLLQDEVARLVFSRKLDVRRLITHQFPLERTAEAIELAAHPTADSLKVIVTQEEGTS